MTEIICEIWKNWAFFLFVPTGFLLDFEQTIYSQSLLYLFNSGQDSSAILTLFVAAMVLKESQGVW